MDRFSIPEMIARLYEARVSGKFGRIEFLGSDGYALIDLPDGTGYAVSPQTKGFRVGNLMNDKQGYGLSVEEAAQECVL